MMKNTLHFILKIRFISFICYYKRIFQGEGILGSSWFSYGTIENNCKMSFFFLLAIILDLIKYRFVLINNLWLDNLNLQMNLTEALNLLEINDLYASSLKYLLYFSKKVYRPVKITEKSVFKIVIHQIFQDFKIDISNVYHYIDSIFISVQAS